MGTDTLIITLFIVTVINVLRYLSSLRTLIVMMKQAHPLLYQKMNRGNFFAIQGDISCQKRLYHYIRSQEYRFHQDAVFIAKCNKVRRLFMLSFALLIALFLAMFVIGFTGL